jgi:hypothetical protein
MWLVLSQAGDESARWAEAGLRARGLAPLELVLAGQLVAARWAHRVGAGAASVEAELPDGRRICGEAVRGVLNRLYTPPDDLLPLVAPDDRDYARQELMAFYMSWLYALPGPMLGRPSPQGLSGAWRHVSEWRWFAARAGLPTEPYRLTSRDLGADGYGDPAGHAPGARTVVVVAGRAVGRDVPEAVLEGSVRLAALAETDLLGVEVAPSPMGTLSFAGASPLPDLRLGGEELLDVLAHALCGGEAPAA